MEIALKFLSLHKITDKANSLTEMGKSATSLVTGFLDSLGATFKSCLRMLPAVGNRGPSQQSGASSGKPLVILGNGPSLRRNLEEDMAVLQGADTLAVNFFANSPEFLQVRPKYYVLADPHFFDKADTDPNVGRLISALNSIDFAMTLLIPAAARRKARLFVNPLLRVETFNFVAVEGFRWFEDAMFDHRFGMPRPRNVLIPSIMIGIWLGYKQIYLLGADHSWLSTLSVNDRNEVVSIQPHFYKEDDREQKRIRQEYVRHPLHEVLESMTIAFRSYHRIQAYASAHGISIVNATPGSMIDAFPRGPLASTNS